jgi:hypothetical protein
VKNFNEEDEAKQEKGESVKINGAIRLKQPQATRITVDKQKSTPKNEKETINNGDRRRRSSGEKRLQKTVMDRNNLSLVKRRCVIPY